MRGHLYCSPRCARDDGRLAFWRPVRERLASPVPPRLALAAVTLGVAAPMLMALRTVGQLERLSLQTPAPPLRRGPTARIESVTEGASGARIEGTASAAGAVLLFGPGGLIGTATVEDGRFRFEGIRQPGPYRAGFLFLSAEAAAEAPAAESHPAPEPLPGPAAAVTRSVPSAPPPRRAAAAVLATPDLTRGPLDRPELVVSFDAGSSSRGARLILDALRERGIRTTVFLTGEFIRHYPELVRRVAADGHEVGNHTDTHPHLTTYARDGRQATRPEVDREFLARQLRAAADAYRQATGRTMAPIWRAPYGEHNSEIRAWAAREGYWHVGWTGGRAGLDGLDWVSDPAARSYRSAGRVVERLVGNAESGGIILLHLGSDREDPVAPRVPELLDALARRGFRFARASEFLDRLGYTSERLTALASSATSASP
jgi:peptidoglycan/xylan/chitin deacetylase (PgdA/CDA1 family)